MVLSKKAVQRNTVLVSGGGERIKAGVAQENISHIISRLTNLYGNPIQAAVREVFSNALDTTMSVPVEDREPIVISSPTIFEPQLIIQDFGCGMSLQDVRDVYANYGVTTKEDNLKAMGSYGLGGKAPLAYTDNFTVETTKGGITTVFIMQTINDEVETEILSSEETGYDSGTKVTIPVKPYDIDAFANVLNVYKDFSWGHPVEIDGELHNGSAAYVEGGEALIFLDKDTEVYGTIRVNRNSVSELLNVFASYTTYRNRLEEYIDYELGGWVYGADGSSYEGDLKPVVVSIVPALVDFSSSRDSITSNEKLEELNKLVREALHDEVFFQTLFEIFRGYSNEELRNFSSDLGSSTITLKGDRFQVKNSNNYKVLFEGPLSLMDSAVGINPYFLSSTELPGSVKVAFSLQKDGVPSRCRTSRQSLFSAALNSELVGRLGSLSESFEADKGFPVSYYSSAIYSSDRDLILVTATTDEEFKVLVRHREALKAHFEGKIVFAFSKISLDKHDSRDMEYTKKLLGDRFSTLTAAKLLKDLEVTRKSLMEERKSSREDKANESLDKQISVVILVGDYSKPETIIEINQRDANAWQRTSMSVRELAATGAPVILGGYYGWKSVYIGAVNAGEPILDRELYFTSENLDPVQWKFLSDYQDRLFMSPQTQKLKVARELAAKRAFHGSALKSVLKNYSEEELLFRCVPQKINYGAALKAIGKRLGEEDSLLKRYIEISQDTQRELIPVLDHEAKDELKRRGYPVATIGGFDEAVRNFFSQRTNDLEANILYTAFIFTKESPEESPLVAMVFDRAAEELKASFNRWLVV